MILKVILEGIGLGVLLILVCAIGIRKGAVGMVHLYSKEVQERCVTLGLTTHAKIKRNALIFKAVCVPGYIAYVLVCVYAVNGARGFLAGNSQITAASALALSLGIAIQNFPEGAIISMPLRAEGESKGKAFLGGVLSGVVEPVGAVLTLLAARLVIPALPYFLSFAAGAMLYVVVEELIPEMSQGRHSNIGTVFFAVGFSIMMTLDVALG